MDNSNEFRGRVVLKGKAMYVSSTSFQEFARCQMKFYYNKIRKVRVRPEFGGGQPAALLFGGAVHQAMESIMSTGEIKPFETYWQPEFFADGGEISYSKQEADFETLLWKGGAIVKEMVNSLHMARYSTTVTDKDEKPLVEYQDFVPIIKDELYLTRTIDAMAIMGGKVTVIDFKTAYRMYSIGMQEEVSEQLTGYLLPHSIPGVPQPEQAMFIVGSKTKTPAGAFFPTTRTERRKAKYRKDLIKMKRIVDLGHYTHCRSDMNCGSEVNPRCEYRPICYFAVKNVVPLSELYYYEEGR